MSLQAAGSAGGLGHGLLAVARRGALDRLRPGCRARARPPRAYRDVEAGTFTHPLGANRAYDYLSRAALGEETGCTERASPAPRRLGPRPERSRSSSLRPPSWEASFSLGA
jgi:hypothetical protein